MLLMAVGHNNRMQEGLMGCWLLLRDCYVIGLPDQLGELRTYRPASCARRALPRSDPMLAGVFRFGRPALVSCLSYDQSERFDCVKAAAPQFNNRSALE